MKSYKTTIWGLIMATLVAVQPIAEGTGYHFDGQTITKILFAAALAAFGYMSKDHDVK
ncbi:hypothetical protein UFOVP215_19 [uncultured Caudovirales phage]|uniref:Uncharacterized protein n=1 Tax=uncultured Caudovirales phage TaxID=2100421 RepID=A0A6J7WQ35_9CAUD|nr:hypothetical protein UFOVP215_19 [uncultured Caudovirales phage]